MLYDCTEKCYRPTNHLADCSLSYLSVMADEDFLALEPLEDIPLPSMASISACDSSFPGLDDSVDIVSSMGTLQLCELSPLQKT